jgi:hypothetical protein
MPSSDETMSQLTKRGPRHIFVHKLGETAVLCPWAQAVVPVRRCLKCKFNVRRQVIDLPRDELRGRGYIECDHTPDVEEPPPTELTKD